MNDEIKEILDKWKCYIELTKKFTTNEYEMLRVEDIEKALDYITNLQQENERLKYQLEVQQDLTIKNRLRKHIYKSRCEKAIDKLRRDYYTNYSQHNDDVVREALNILQNGSDEDE